MKRKFGDTIRNKSPITQKNETVLKVLCYNRVGGIHEIHEAGATGMLGCPTG